MITFSEAQLLAWLQPLLWPFLRALALFGALPVLGQRSVPARVRVALAAFIAIAAQPTLPPVPPVALDSLPQVLPLVAQQMIIGLALGFSVRLVFAAVEFAGELIGLQMGLNFAGFFDPISARQARKDTSAYVQSSAHSRHTPLRYKASFSAGVPAKRVATSS